MAQPRKSPGVAREECSSPEGSRGPGVNGPEFADPTDGNSGSRRSLRVFLSLKSVQVLASLLESVRALLSPSSTLSLLIQRIECLPPG